MEKILEHLNAALNELKLKQQKASALAVESADLKARCKAQLDMLKAKEEDLREREAAVKRREENVKEIENIEAEKQRLVSVKNELAKEESRILAIAEKNETKEKTLIEKAKKLGERELELSREKESYKEKVKKEVFDKIASGK